MILHVKLILLVVIYLLVVLFKHAKNLPLAMSYSVLILPVLTLELEMVQQEIEESLDLEDSLEEFSKVTPMVPMLLVRMRQTLLTKPTKTIPLMRTPPILILVLLMILHLDQNHLHLLQAL